MESRKFKTVDEYFSSLEDDQRTQLLNLRELILEECPEAEETISYNMPALRDKKIILYYAAFQKHISLFPMAATVKAFQEKLNNYRISKGTIQFPLEGELPKNLIREMIRFRLQEMKKPKTKKN